MNAETEAADFVLRIVIESTAYFFKLAASLSEPLRKKAVDAIYKALYSTGIGPVNPDMKAIIQKGEGICVFQLAEKDEPRFDAAAKELGLRYVPVKSQERPDAEDRITMIVCSAGDAQLVNGILVQNKLHGRDVAKADQATSEPIEKPKSPEEQKDQNDAFKAYYNIDQNQTDLEPALEDGKENPTRAADPTTGSPSATESTTIEYGSTSEPLDIEHLHSEVETTGFESGRFSVRERISEIKNSMEQGAHSQTPAAKKSALQESVEQQLKNQAAEGLPQKG